jgi:hypothetical protein
MLHRVSFYLIEDTIPHPGGTPCGLALGFTPAINAVGCIRDRSKSAQRNRLATAITITINSATVSGDGVVDRIEFSAFSFDQLTIEFILDGIGSSIKDVAGPFLMQFSEKTQITFQSTMQCIATTDQLLSQVFD